MPVRTLLPGLSGKKTAARLYAYRQHHTRVMLPSITDFAAIKRSQERRGWLKNTEPSCWYCPRSQALNADIEKFDLDILPLPTSAASRSWRSLSCIPVTICTRLLCATAAWAKTGMIELAAVLHKQQYPAHI